MASRLSETKPPSRLSEVTPRESRRKVYVFDHVMNRREGPYLIRPRDCKVYIPMSMNKFHTLYKNGSIEYFDATFSWQYCDEVKDEGI